MKRVTRTCRRRTDRGGVELATLVLFCLGVELACLAAWIFG